MSLRHSDCRKLSLRGAAASLAAAVTGRCLVGAACVLLSTAVVAQDAAPWSKDLTPLGGERAGNRAGTIPAWSDEAQAAAGFQPGRSLRQDAWRHKGDKPLYSVDAGNAAEHEEKLTPGMRAVLKAFPSFKMDVYPTRRSCSAPGFVAENTKKNVGFAKLGDDGWSLREAYVPGVPFPQPKAGVEVMWNQKMRYRGVGAVISGATFLSPRAGATDWIKPRAKQTIFWHWGAEGSRKVSELGGVASATYFTYVEPVALAGQAAFITDYLDKPGTDTYYYFPGQRRVRRMPAYAYDAPQIGFENQYAIDDTQVFMGALDRFDWKLVGKKEMIVPYNSFGAFDFKSDWQTIVHSNGLPASHRRYELHRVWVIEATVKAGVRHLAPKRRYYVDEDSWNTVLAEDYDAQGKLVKVREGYLIPVFELGGACDVSAFAQYSVNEGRTLLDFSAIGGGADHVYSTKPTTPAMRLDFYQPDNLRAISER